MSHHSCTATHSHTQPRSHTHTLSHADTQTGTAATHNHPQSKDRHPAEYTQGCKVPATGWSTRPTRALPAKRGHAAWHRRGRQPSSSCHQLLQSTLNTARQKPRFVRTLVEGTDCAVRSSARGGVQVLRQQLSRRPVHGHPQVRRVVFLGRTKPSSGAKGHTWPQRPHATSSWPDTRVARVNFLCITSPGLVE